jgi:predicted AAA+ superfamily ATPase
MNQLDTFLSRAERLLERLEPLLPSAPQPPDWSATAFRWRRLTTGGRLEAVHHPHGIRLWYLHVIDEQKRQLQRNTAQFVAGHPANNALLWGARGTGKSSLVKALLNAFAEKGLRLVEVERSELVDLPLIVEQLEGRSERFVVFCDDLSFEAGDPAYKALKVVLDGSIAGASENVLIYATSNRRHLLPETMEENRQARVVDGELHPAESTDEKIALSDRFGMWLSFYPFDQEGYLAIVDYWVAQLGGTPDRDTYRQAAVQWALARGNRSGRSAWHFARDWVGARQLQDAPD